MKKDIHISAITVLALCLATASCTVKEDRQPCPCWLDMDISGCSEHTRDVHVSAWRGDNIFYDKVSVADYPDVYERTVEKGMVTTSAFCGLLRSSVQGRTIIIPEGSQSDQIRAHSALVDCSGESARDSVELYRQYATVHLAMKRQDGERYPYTIEVRADVCGIDYVSLSPVAGDFRFRPDADADGNWIFRLPRQETDGRIEVAVFLQEVEMDRLPLNEWIDRSGYSWLDRDLKDIYIAVDYALGKVSVSVHGWQKGEFMDMVL